MSTTTRIRRPEELCDDTETVDTPIHMYIDIHVHCIPSVAAGRMPKRTYIAARTAHRKSRVVHAQNRGFRVRGMGGIDDTTLCAEELCCEQSVVRLN